MNPVIALVGRPNVGKSTLFNRFTRSRDALVAEFSGLTRDRKYGDGKFDDRSFVVIDTGGISGLESGLDAAMAAQSFAAIAEADTLVLVVDAQAGLTAGDSLIAEQLRRHPKPIVLCVNKTDGSDPELAIAEFFALGLGQPVAIAAAHNRGVSALLERVLAPFPVAQPSADLVSEERIRLAIIGRPNVGKSTLVNRMLGEDRVVVYDHPGTTTDSIYIPYQRADQDYMLIDTAGVRRRKNINAAVEKFSIVKTLQAMQQANVVVLLIDAQEGLVEQDMHLLGFALDAGRALVVAVNKWDGLVSAQREQVKAAISRRLPFLEWADIHFISAKHGTNVGHLYASVEEAYRGARSKWSTNQLTKLMQGVVELHQPPMVGAHRIKLRYAHQGGSNPPLVVIHGNQLHKLPGSYRRYLENAFRKALAVRGTPIRFEFKVGENPYAERPRRRRTPTRQPRPKQRARR